MSNKLPPQPLGVAPGSSYWNDWYEKLRTFVDTITTSVDWSIITGKPTTLAGYGITDGQTKLNNSAGLAAALSDETGTGLVVFNTSPTLVTPVLGTPSSATLTNATGLPIASGVSGLGAGVATFLATPSSANLATAVTGETGTGALVFANTPTLVTPILGAATGTSLALAGPITGVTDLTTTGNTILGNAVGDTLNVANGKIQVGAGGDVTIAPQAGQILTYTGAYSLYNNGTYQLFFGTGSLTGGAAAADGCIRCDTGPIRMSFAGTTAYTFSQTGLLTTASTTLHATSVALANGAAANLGTLTNAPTAGNPTKWVPINDNGTTRYIPAW